MSFAITLSVTGDIGPGGTTSLGGALAVGSVERLAETIAAFTPRSFAVMPVPPHRLRLLAIVANDYRNLTIALNGTAPARPLTGPEAITGAMLELAGGAAIHTIAIENIGPEDVVVEILVCRDP